MNINDIKKAGGVVVAELVDKEINFIGADGEKHTATVKVRRASWADTVDLFSVLRVKGLDATMPKNQIAAKIHGLVRFGDGTEVLDLDDCLNLSESLGGALTMAIEQVNPSPVNDAGKN